MSGHSKWATTKNKKAAIDAKRANSFTKASKNISIAARKGGDPETNFSLRMMIEKAKEVNMPRENIERAIKRGTGELGGAVLEEVMYEAYGPSGVALVVEAVTDNRSRTTSNVRAILNKYSGSLGATNSVAWMFDHKGVIRLPVEGVNSEELSLELIDMGADDVVEEDAGLTVYCTFTAYEGLKKALELKNLKPEYSELEWVAKDKQAVSEEVQQKTDKLIEAFEDDDDVNAVFTNIK